jgi:hypothetical protein
VESWAAVVMCSDTFLASGPQANKKSMIISKNLFISLRWHQVDGIETWGSKYEIISAEHFIFCKGIRKIHLLIPRHQLAKDII